MFKRIYECRRSWTPKYCVEFSPFIVRRYKYRRAIHRQGIRTQGLHSLRTYEGTTPQNG